MVELVNNYFEPSARDPSDGELFFFPPAEDLLFLLLFDGVPPILIYVVQRG